MEDRELLKQILNKLSELEHGQQKMQKDIDNIQSKVDGIETKVNQIETKVNQIDSKVDRNYDKTLEFYGYQRESNTEISEKFEQMSARAEIFENQTVRNTADIRRIK